MILTMERTPRKLGTRMEGGIKIQQWEPGELHYYVDGKEVQKEEYEFFYNDWRNDNFKEKD